MTKPEPSDLHIAEIRQLAQRYSADTIEQCMELALAHKENPCFADDAVEEAMNVLAKAEFVKTLVEQGQSLPGAMRELGRRIRAAQGT